MSEGEVISQYDYHLPDDLIAQVPKERRDASRLLVIDRQRKSIEHRQFTDLPELLAPGDLLILNDTRVVPARLFGTRTATGGKWEGLFLREEPEGRWRIIGQTRGTLLPGERISLHPAQSDSSNANNPNDQTSISSIDLLLEERHAGGDWIVHPQSDLPSLTLLDQFGTMPLPHYLQREADESDKERYQTSYATRPGAVAAPTAGLHFTPEILQRCQERGIETAKVTLHVGLGTFRPVSVEKLSEHRMHQEWCELPEESANAIEAARKRGGRVIAVGTTSVRTVESIAQSGPLRAWHGETDLFIRPPYQFQVVEGMLTNFHLPKSTLLVLVCTFAGRELILKAYEEAIQQRYRFYSYGDAMLIL